MLGAVNTRAAHSADRLRLRDEYNKFKDRTNIAFLAFPALWALTQLYLRHYFRTTHWVYIMTHIWLLYYYTSLALRENILRVNGSAIKPWWIYHHYVSAMCSVVVLTCESGAQGGVCKRACAATPSCPSPLAGPADSASWEHMLPSLTAYFFYQGFVQVMQARYQKARHYQRVAMGKATAMDVSATETLTEAHRGLYLIVALVIGAQAWQVWQGATLLHFLFARLRVLDHAWWNFHEEAQCGAVGALFVVLGLLNFYYTVETLVEKAGAGPNRRRIAAQAGAASGLGLVPSGSAAAELSRLGGAASPGLPRASPVSTPQPPFPLRPVSAAAAAAAAAGGSATATPPPSADAGTPIATAAPAAAAEGIAALPESAPEHPAPEGGAPLPLPAVRAVKAAAALPPLPPSPGGALLGHSGAGGLQPPAAGTSSSVRSRKAQQQPPAAAASVPAQGGDAGLAPHSE